MSDLIEINLGRRPWSPTAGTEMVEVLHRYDGPLLAIVRQAGTNYMARCILGETGDISLWVYSRLDDDQTEALADSGPDDMDELAERLSYGDVKASLADVHGGIRFACSVEVPYDLTGSAMRAFIAKQIHAELSSALNETAQIELTLV